jgi:hypothetical protein
MGLCRLIFDLSGATYSIFFLSTQAGDYLFMALPLILAFGSYIFYLKKIKAEQSSPNHFAYYESREIKISDAVVA